MRRVLLLTAIVTACGPIGCSGPNAASTLAKPPAWDPKGQVKCGVRKSAAEPLVVEWPSAARAKLEALAQRSLVAVRYEGCDMEVLPSCAATKQYTYHALAPKHDRLAITTEDELYANLPLGALHLEGALKKSGSLGVDMTIVGRWQAEGTPTGADLQGDCSRATHVVTALTVGAFRFYTGAAAAVQGGAGVSVVGAGGKSEATHEMLARDGDEQACSASSRSDVAPPFGCGAILRLEVIPVSAASSTASAPPPACPSGTRWDGARCVALPVTCPTGAAWNGAACVTPGAPAPTPASDGFWCYRFETKTTPPRHTTCMGNKPACEEGRAHDARVPGTLNLAGCEMRTNAACFRVRHSQYCYEDFGECNGVARTYGIDECDGFQRWGQ